jgi:hypothetical protein
MRNLRDLMRDLENRTGGGERSYFTCVGRESGVKPCRVHRPLATIGSVTPDGIPYMAPEIQLLYKAKAPRPQDEADFVRTFPHLNQASREFLVQALALVYPGHRWLLELEAAKCFQGILVG